MKAFLKKLGKLRFWSITSESYTCKDTRRFISTVKKEDSPPSVVGYIGDLFVDLDFIGFVLVLFLLVFVENGMFITFILFVFGIYMMYEKRL